MTLWLRIGIKDNAAPFQKELPLHPCIGHAKTPMPQAYYLMLHHRYLLQALSIFISAFPAFAVLYWPGGWGGWGWSRGHPLPPS